MSSNYFLTSVEADASSNEGPAVLSRAPSPQLAPTGPLAPAASPAVSPNAQPASQSVDAKSTPTVSPSSATGFNGNVAVDAKPVPQTACSPAPSSAPAPRSKSSSSAPVPDDNEEATNEDNEFLLWKGLKAMKEAAKKKQAELEKEKALAAASASAPEPEDIDTSGIVNQDLLDPKTYGFLVDKDGEETKATRSLRTLPPLVGRG